MGKSSLLRYIYTRSAELFPGSLPAVVYLDLMKAYCHTRRGFIKALRLELTKKLGTQPWTEAEDEDLGALSFAFERLSQEGVRLILCLDKMEELTKRRSEFEVVLEELRAAGQMGQVGLLTASGRPLADLCQNDGLISPFHNIFIQDYLGLFSEREWKSLVTGRMFILEPELDAIQRLSNGHPLYTQLAARNLWDARQGIGESDWETRTLEKLAQHWASQWDHLWPNEQAALRTLAGLPGSQPGAPLLASLSRRGLVQKGRPFSEAFADWLRSSPGQG
jgi:hypothetical protein